MLIPINVVGKREGFGHGLEEIRNGKEDVCKCTRTLSGSVPPKVLKETPGLAE